MTKLEESNVNPEDLPEGRISSGDCRHSEFHGFREFDLYDYFEQRNILGRPAMWLGRKSITAFGHFYMGLSELGGRSLGGPMQFKLKNELFHSGFTDWAKKKHNYGGAICLFQMYTLIENAKDPTTSNAVIEARGFDRFVEDLKEFRAQQEKNNG